METSETDTDHIIDRQLAHTINTNLFDEQAPFLNAFFRFQLGSNTFDGYEFAMEAWRRVAAVNQNMDGEGQTLESLRLQKDAVKRELKLFDVHFAKFYGRQPSRLDKECLRRLYEFHKQLKAYIAAEEVKVERRFAPGMQDSQSSNNRPDGMSLSSTAPRTTSQKDEELAPDMDLRVLKAEKRALKIKLRRFEDEFIRQHGHKPQSYQEVGVIREDYSRYKFLKEALQAKEGGPLSPSTQPPPHGHNPQHHVGGGQHVGGNHSATNSSGEVRHASWDRSSGRPSNPTSSSTHGRGFLSP